MKQKELIKVGEIAFVQIQTDKLKVDEDGQRYYRPKPIRQMEKLLLTAQGISGVDADGLTFLDVHHQAHPNSRNSGHNSVSFGFLGNYARMRERFGGHIADGIGGENIIIDADRHLTESDFAGGVMIQHLADDNMIELYSVMVAAPCAPFSTYCLNYKPLPAELKAAIQFLDNGTRGYYATAKEKDCQCYISAGDPIYLIRPT